MELTVYTLKLHSVVDLITNSSTVIFTDSKNAVEAVKKLFNAMLAVHGIEEDVEKVLDIQLEYRYYDLIERAIYDLQDSSRKYEKWSYEKCREKIEKDIKAYIAGEDAPEYLEDSMGNMPQDGISSFVKITAKDAKYEEVAKLLYELTYSVETQEGSTD